MSQSNKERLENDMKRWKEYKKYIYGGYPSVTEYCSIFSYRTCSFCGRTFKNESAFKIADREYRGHSYRYFRYYSCKNCYGSKMDLYEMLTRVKRERDIRSRENLSKKQSINDK